MAGLKELELDRYQVLLFIASELLVLKGLAENSSDKDIVQELNRISWSLIERAKIQARSMTESGNVRSN
ncbi:MAG: hypothetical protein HC855_00770 [Rhizobiales bacterium]|nr:hypothetical protein [Hyphomicrobiales bacterium]